MAGEDQQHNLAGGKRIDDGFPVLFAGQDVARRNPARNALRFKRGTGGIRNLLIVR